jgi:hypothetical protein
VGFAGTEKRRLQVCARGARKAEVRNVVDGGISENKREGENKV